jgi:hypothetical protein
MKIQQSYTVEALTKYQAGVWALADEVECKTAAVGDGKQATLDGYSTAI